MLRFLMIAKIATASLMTVFVGMSVNAADRISDFSLTDSEGRFFQLSRHSDEQAIVLFSYDPQSRDARRAASDLADVAEQFEGQKVEFELAPSRDGRQSADNLVALD